MKLVDRSSDPWTSTTTGSPRRRSSGTCSVTASPLGWSMSPQPARYRTGTQESTPGGPHRTWSACRCPHGPRISGGIRAFGPDFGHCGGSTHQGEHHCASHQVRSHRFGCRPHGFDGQGRRHGAGGSRGRHRRFGGQGREGRHHRLPDLRPLRAGGAYGTQPPDGRGHQDQGVEGPQGLGRRLVQEGRERRGPRPEDQHVAVGRSRSGGLRRTAPHRRTAAHRSTRPHRPTAPDHRATGRPQSWPMALCV